MLLPLADGRLKSSGINSNEHSAHKRTDSVRLYSIKFYSRKLIRTKKFTAEVRTKETAYSIKTFQF